MNVTRYLLENGNGDDPALIGLQGTCTYAELRAASSAVAAFLVSKGARKGDRVLLIAENGLFWAAAYLGAMQAGLISVPLPRKIPFADANSIFASIEARFAFLEQRVLPRFAPALAGVTLVSDYATPLPSGGECHVLEQLLRRAPAGPRWEELEPDDLAALMFTSGSTGAPRGVMVSARNILANTNSIIEYLSLTASDRIMAVLPFHYCFGASLLHTHLRAGGSVVIDPRFMYPDKVLERMVETGCTGFAGVPSHYQILLRRSSLAKMEFPALRYVQQAGGHLAPAFVDELRQALPGKQIFIMYGQTEATARLAYLPPGLLDPKRGSAGQAIPGVRLAVVNEAGQPVGPGEIGEVVAEGDNITRGYWRDPAETAKSFRNGKLYTGDLGTVDHDGFIFLADRAKDFLKCGGQRVSCRSLEDMLLECDALLEAAVIGIPDPVLGEAVKAFVVPRDGRTESLQDQVRDHCRGRLPLPLVPREIVVVDSLPKNSSGKVIKGALREQSQAATS